MGTKMIKESNMLKTRVLAAALCCIFLSQAIALLAQGAGSTSTYPAPILKIGSGDLIQVSMFENPELSGTFRVDANGDIMLPLVGTVHVAGQTSDEAGAQIVKRYVQGGILKAESAYATVSVLEYATQGITVNGEVKEPGIYPALGVRMLNDVIAAAGGETAGAASKVVITHRNDPAHPVDVYYNPSALSPTVPQVQILPGDSIMVPRAGIVYVLGDVMRSGGFVLDGRQVLTMEEAMALAGGGAKAANFNRVQLVRSLKDGRKEAITISVNDIYKGKAPDVALKDGDVVYVPSSTGKLVAEQAITSALGIGTSVVIYRTAYQ
jgi:polysaccharide biosynthesis/export protein